MALLWFGISLNGCAADHKLPINRTPSSPPDNPSTKLEVDRLEGIDLLFEQVQHGYNVMDIFLNRPNPVTSGPACITYTYRDNPEDNSFLSANYDGCTKTIESEDGTYTINFTGKEIFTSTNKAKTLRAETVDLIVSVRPVEKNLAQPILATSRVVEYLLKRRIRVDFASAEDQIADFFQENSLSALDPKDKEKYDSWKTEISGWVQVGPFQTVATSPELTPPPTRKIISFIKGTELLLTFAYPRLDPKTRRITLIDGSLKLTNSTPDGFHGSCHIPGGRFEWLHTEKHGKSPRRQQRGIFDSDQGTMSDPTGTDPVLQKPRPWGDCPS